MSITPLPSPPEPTDSTSQFNTKAFAWVAALDTWTTEANALTSTVNALEDSTIVFAGQAQTAASQAAASATASANSATTALGHASAAAANTNAPLWVSGTTYAAGALVYSSVDGRTYRRKTAGSGTTNPASDPTNWTPILLEVATLRPTIRPSLNLDFANTKQLDSRITFTRASSATYYGTQTAKAEENLLLYSQEFDNTTAYPLAARVGLLSVNGNVATAPNGTETADSIVEDTGTTIHVLSGGCAVSGTVTLSVFAELGSGTRFLTIGLSRDTSNHGSATFNLSSGTVTQTQANGTYSAASATITAEAQGFYRCTLTVTTDTASSFRFGLNDTGTPTTSNRGFGANYTGDGTSSLILWGGQLEARSQVTAYTPTTTQPITNYIPVLQTASANVARFDHDPVTGESLGLLVEEQRTNLLTYSEDFANAAWTKTRASITSNTIVAPDGTLTGDKLVEDTSTTTTHFTNRLSIGTITAGATISFSTYVKSAEKSDVSLLVHGDGNFSNRFEAVFNLATGVVRLTNAAGTGSVAGAIINPVGNGWYRVSVIGIVDTTSTVVNPRIQLTNNTGATSYTGDGYSGIYIWGAQLEAGSKASSYIKTEASQVTRSADLESITGDNFSSWYNFSEGTLYVESQTPIASSVFMNVVSVDESSTTTAAIQLARNGTNSRGFGRDVSIDQGSGTFPVDTFVKQALAGKFNDFALSTNGSVVAVDTSTQPLSPNTDRLRIRVDSTGASQFIGHIKKIAYYPQRLSNTQLQALTS